jgi:hypothetical protein
MNAIAKATSSRLITNTRMEASGCLTKL